MNGQTSIMRKAIASPASGDDPLLYVLSDETVDRAGDIIRASGWDLTNFLKNPIALFGHSHSFVIGRWSDVKVRGKQLIGRLNLLPEGVSQRLDELRAAVSAGVLRSISVGFLPDPESAEPNKHGGYTFGRAELTEASLVAVGMNPNSLQIAKSLNLSADARALIFGGGGSHRAAVHLDRPKSARAVTVEVVKARVPVVKLDPVSKARLSGTLKIHTPKPWRPGDPVRIITPDKPRVVRLEKVFCPWLDQPKKALPVVRITDADRRRAKHRVVKLGNR